MKHTKIYHITARFLLAAILLAVSWTSAKAAETVAAYAVLSDNNTVLTFYYDDQINSRGGMSVQDLGWLQMSSSVTSVQFDRTFASYSPESTSYWFSEMSQLQALDLSNLNMASVTNTDGMFMNSSRLTTIIVNDTWPAAESAMTPDGSSGVSGAEMFNGCRSLVGGAGTTYDAQHIDYSYAHIDGGVDDPGYFTDAAGSAEAYAAFNSDYTVLTFYYDNQKAFRNGMDLGPFPNADYRGWNSYAGNITKVVFDSSMDSYTGLTSTASWFWEFTNLEEVVDIKYLHTDNVTSMDGMFGIWGGTGSTPYTGKLPAVDMTHFNTSKVVNMNGIFSNCAAITALDLSSFDTSSVTDMSAMFSGCTGLRTISVGSGWTTAKVTNSSMMFQDCTSLVGGAGTTYDASHTDVAYAHIDGGTSNPGYLTGNGTSVAEPYAVLDGTTLTFYYDNQKSARNGMSVGPFSIPGDRQWESSAASVTTVKFDESMANCTSLTSTAYWFYGFQTLTTVTGIGNLKTDNVTDMQYMFHDCNVLTSIDVTGFNTTNVTNMRGMFYKCQQLQSLDLSSFNTALVTDMSWMFYGCNALTKIIAGSEWTAEGVVTDEDNAMFMNCTKLVGGAGTTYDETHADHTYARIDGGTSAPGYFTDKNTSDGWVNNGNFEGNDYSCFVYKLNGEETEIAVTAQDVVTDSEDATNHCLKVTTSPYPQNSWDCQFFVKFNKAIPKGETIHISLRAKASDAVNMAYEQQEEPFVYITTEGGLDLSTTWNTYQLEITSQSDSFKTLAFHLNGYEKEHVDFYFDDITITLDSKVEPYAVLTDNGSVVTDGEGTTLSGKTLTFYYDDQKAVRGGMEVKPFQIGTYNGVWGVNSGWSEHCKAITTVEFDESFANCTTLTSTDYWFYSFSNLTTVRNIENLKTPNVTTMECMFGYCSSLTSLDLSSLNTDNVTSLYGMFLECTSLKTLDLSGFNTSKVTNMNQLFYPCSSLKTIYVGSGWSTEAVTEGNYIFNGCTSLVGGAGTRYDSNHVDKTYARIDGGTSAPGYFTVKTTTTTPEPYAVLSNNNTVLTFYYDDQKSARGGMDIGPFAYLEHGFGESQRPWHDVRESIVYAVIDPSMSQYTSLVSTGWWFYGCKNLKSVSGWENLYPLNIVDMWGTFEYCSSLPSDPAAGGPDFSNFYSNSLKRTVAMFHGCTSMTSLDLSALNTSNVTENEGMFEGCSALTTIYVGSGWDMSNATDNWIDNMFSGCTSLVGGAGTRYDANNIGTSYAHIDGGVDNPGYLTELIRKPLTAADYFEWTGMKANATKKSESPYPNCYYILGQSAEIPYGEPDVNPYTYADLSAYDRLEVTATGNTPRILLNRDSVGGQWNEDEALSHMIESTQRGWSSKYFSHSGNVWTVDLKQIVADKGFAHLNAIKGDSWSAVTVIKIELVKINSTATAGNATFDDHLGVLIVEGDLTMQQACEQAGGRQPIAERITSLIWNSSVVLTESDLDGFTNPNMLIFVGNKDKTTLTRNNVVIEGKARKVVLSDVASGNGDFWCPQEFFADSIIYTHNYKQATEIGVSRGWETIALPFDVQTITHEKNGVIAPFGSSASDKHFWLRTLVDEQGLARATKIEANHAYLISMPNNGKYPAEYNLAGNVTFATAGVVVPETIYRASQLTTDNGRIILMPNFLRLYASEYYYVLNVGEARGGHPEGSVFEVNYREALPFQAFTYHEGNQNPSRFISLDELMEGITGIETIEQPQWSGAEQWWSIDGRKLNGKPSQKGVYIRNGKKVVVKATF